MSLIFRLLSVSESDFPLSDENFSSRPTTHFFPILSGYFHFGRPSEAEHLDLDICLVTFVLNLFLSPTKNKTKNSNALL